MAKWVPFNPAAVLGADISGAADGASDAVGTIVDFMETTVLPGLDTAKTFLLGLDEFDFAAALALAVDEFRQSLNASGIYYLGVWDAGLDDYLKDQAKAAWSGSYTDPAYAQRISDYFENRYTFGKSTFSEVMQAAPARTQGSSWNRFLTKIIASFDDLGDQARPQFPDGGELASIVIVGGAPSFQEYVILLAQLVRLFDTKELHDLYCTLLRILLTGVNQREVYPPAAQSAFEAAFAALPPSVQAVLLPPSECFADPSRAAVAGGSSVPPNWSTTRIREMGSFMRQLFQVIDIILVEVVSALRIGANSQTAAVALIGAIEVKIQKLTDTLSELQAILAQLDALTGTGLYALYIEANGGGNEGIKTALLAADTSEVPFAQSIDAFLAGAVFLAGGPGIGPFQTLFAPTAVG